MPGEGSVSRDRRLRRRYGGVWVCRRAMEERFAIRWEIVGATRMGAAIRGVPELRQF